MQTDPEVLAVFMLTRTFTLMMLGNAMNHGRPAQQLCLACPAEWREWDELGMSFRGRTIATAGPERPRQFLVRILDRRGAPSGSIASSPPWPQAQAQACAMAAHAELIWGRQHHSDSLWTRLDSTESNSMQSAPLAAAAEVSRPRECL